ncbi:MAG: AAA family ATPase, partial [Ignavibacteriaceae bacterium]
QPTGKTVLLLEFEFNEDEINSFRKEIKSRINGTLPLIIEIDRNRVATVKVHKKGKGATSLSKKSRQISLFISNRLDFEHIPAVRTADAAQQIVDALVERELFLLEDDENYLQAIKKIEDLQKPVLLELSESIKKTLKLFLPKIKNVKIEVNSEERYEALRQTCSIFVDDGVPTLLKYKGDGVQSLAALGLMRHSSVTKERGKNLVIAIEEPESHLHPKAIHEVKEVLNELKKNHQIVLTTHNPLFIDRSSIKSNIIVNNKKAYPARTIKEIREILGVRASDNLRHAELVLVVEGEDDKVSAEALLKFYSPKLKNAIEQGTLAIDYLGGGTNLAYKLGIIRESLCSYHCFLDYDKTGRESFKKAEDAGLITSADVNYTICDGKTDSELEDLLNKSLYEELLNNKYRIVLTSSKFRSNKKWSERMRDTFKQHGKDWDDKTEKEIKMKIADLVASNPSVAINENSKSIIEGLILNLEMRFEEINNSKP